MPSPASNETPLPLHRRPPTREDADGAAVAAALDAIVHGGLRAAALGLACLFAVFAVAHAIVVPRPIAPPLIIAAATTACLFMGMFLALGRREIPLTWTHPLAGAMAGLVLFNALVHLALSADPLQTTNLLLLLLGVACSFLSTRWFIGFLVAPLLGWVIIASRVTLSREWVHFGFALVTTAVLAAIVYAMRRQTFVRLVRLRLGEAARMAEMEAAFVSMEDARRRAESSQRSAEEAHSELVAVQEADSAVRDIITRARCILWSAEVRQFGSTFDWVFEIPDEVAAQEVYPLAVPPGMTYEQVWYRSRHPDDDRRMDETSREAMISGRDRYSQEFRCTDGAGRERWLFEEVTLEARGPGHWHAVGVCTDITERKRLETELHRHMEELAAADRRKDDFLAMLAHELRNPLAPIRNALYLMRRCATEGADLDRPMLDRLMEIVERQVKQMTRLIDDLLEVSRITRGKIDLRKEWVDLATVVNHAIETTRPLLQARQHELSVSLPADAVEVDADPTRLEQVFANLLTNAAKYTPEGGRIAIEVVTQGGEAAVRVRDNGIGMDPEMIPGLFDLFAQGERSLDRSDGGLGVGLTVVKHLVQLHGGRVTATSAGVGQGSEFEVRLPVLSRPEALTEETKQGVPWPRRAMKILVVDDNQDAAQSLAEILEAWGQTTRIAYDGPTAIVLAAEFQPEVALLDLGLPIMDGYEVARRLHAEQAGILLVAVSGYAQQEDRERAERAGFEHHLVKPVDPEELQRILARASEGPALMPTTL